MACKREATEADIIDSSVVDVNLLLGLKRKPVSQQNVVEIKAMFAAERKEKKRKNMFQRILMSPSIIFITLCQCMTMLAQ